MPQRSKFFSYSTPISSFTFGEMEVNEHATDEFNDQLLHDIKTFDNDAVFTALQQQANLHKMADRSGSTLLHYASDRGNNAVVRRLIEMEANVNAQDETGKTPLMLSIQKRRIDIVEILLEANADIFITNYDGHTSLHLVVSDPSADWNIVKMFLERVRIYCQDMSVRIKSNYSKELTALLLSKANCFLQHVMRWNEPDVMRYLLAAGCPVDSVDPRNRETALHVAVRELNWDNILLLLVHGADVNATNKNGQTPFMLLRCVEDDENKKKLIITMLLLNWKDTDIYRSDKYGETGMGVIFKHGTPLTVRIAMDCINPFNLCMKDSCGLTPLHYLAQSKYDDAIETIEGLKFDANISDDYLNTPLHVASLAGNSIAVELLLKNGANVNARDISGRTAIFNSLIIPNFVGCNVERNRSCLILLLKNGADIECNLKKPKTALHLIRSFYVNLFGKPILMHLAMREALGVSITDTILKKINSTDNFKRHLNLYRRIIKRMQTFTVYGSVTLFKLMTESEEKIVRYVYNPKVVKRLVRLSYKILMSNYCFRYLSDRIEDAIKTAQLRQQAARALGRMTKIDYNSYSMVLDQLVGYLNDGDLINLVKS